MYPAQIARALDINKSLVKYHIDTLTQQKFLIKNRDSYPHYYSRGTRAAIFEGLIDSEPERKYYARGEEFKNSRWCRTHTPSPFSIDVFKVGDVDTYAHQTNNGPITYSLFPKQPYKHHNKVASYKTRLIIGDNDIAIQYHASKVKDILQIWPGEVHQTIEELYVDNCPFQKTIDLVVNELSKYAGWKFGGQSWDGRTHYAFYVEGIEVILQPRQYENGNWWVDKSKGYYELETSNRTLAIQCMKALSQEGL